MHAGTGEYALLEQQTDQDAISVSQPRIRRLARMR
jgi:hypothetical protein